MHCSGNKFVCVFVCNTKLWQHFRASETRDGSQVTQACSGKQQLNKLKTTSTTASRVKAAGKQINTVQTATPRHGGWITTQEATFRVACKQTMATNVQNWVRALSRAANTDESNTIIIRML